MIARRGLLGGGAALALARPAAGQGPAPAGGDLHALLVGINAYRTTPLRGCMNDTELLRAALGPMSASVGVLRDADASRAGFDRAWAEASGRCRAGDRLLFAFSGHGSRKPKARPDPRTGATDDFLVFAPFHHRDAPAEILTSDELERLFAAVGRRGVAVVFVADCCHSGSLTRGVDPAAGRQRTVRTLTGDYPVEQLVENLLSAPPPPPRPPKAELEHVLFFAAGRATEEVPEIDFRGRKHGALSVAVATGLDGGAGEDDTGRITARSLADHVLRTVRGIADARQTPVVKIGARAPAVLREAARPGPAVPPSPGPVERRIRLFVDGAAPPGSAAWPGVELVPPGAEFDLLWRPATGETVSPLGDLVAEGVREEGLPASVDRVRALRRLRAMATERALEVRVELRRPGDGTRPAQGRGDNAAHRAGAKLLLVVEAIAEPNFVLINIAGDGAVQALFPFSDPGRRFEEPLTPPGGRLVLDDVEVRPPFGTDQLVAVAAGRPLSALALALRGLERRREPMTAVAAVERAVAGGRWQVGLAGLFTRA